MQRRRSCSARFHLAFLAALALGACRDRPTEPATSHQLDGAAAVITAAGVAADVAVLAADSMRGRRTPGRELNQAADYIAGVFQGAGLRAGADGGSYRQTYPCPGAPYVPANLIAILPGSSARLADDWVVVSAHYDHIGVGVPNALGDSIYNGADDNASGTAGLLAVARAFAALGQAPPRSVAFVAVSGEEQGFVGAWYFVDHHPALMKRIVANINLDMLGRNAPGLLYALGESLSSLGPSVRLEVERHPELGLTLQRETQIPASYQSSDQIAFAGTGVPAIFLHTGTHGDLHQPTDELSRLDTDKVARISRLAFRVAWDVASDSVPPAWTPVGDTALPHLRYFRGTCGK